MLDYIKSAAEVQAEAEEKKRAADRQRALSYLGETDWFVTRQAETGKPVPPDVAKKRAAARKTASS